MSKAWKVEERKPLEGVMHFRGREYYHWGMEGPARKPYPSDVSDEEWAFVAFVCLLLHRAIPLFA